MSSNQECSTLQSPSPHGGRSSPHRPTSWSRDRNDPQSGGDQHRDHRGSGSELRHRSRDRNDKRSSKDGNTPSRPHERHCNLNTSNGDTHNDKRRAPNYVNRTGHTPDRRRQTPEGIRDGSSDGGRNSTSEGRCNTGGTPRRGQGSTPSRTGIQSPSTSKADYPVEHCTFCGRSGHRAQFCCDKGDKGKNPRPPHWKSRKDRPGSCHKRSTLWQRTGSTGFRSGSQDKRRSNSPHPWSCRTNNDYNDATRKGLSRSKSLRAAPPNSRKANAAPLHAVAKKWAPRKVWPRGPVWRTADCSVLHIGFDGPVTDCQPEKVRKTKTEQRELVTPMPLEFGWSKGVIPPENCKDIEGLPDTRSAVLFCAGIRLFPEHLFVDASFPLHVTGDKNTIRGGTKGVWVNVVLPARSSNGPRLFCCKHVFVCILGIGSKSIIGFPSLITISFHLDARIAVLGANRLYYTPPLDWSPENCGLMSPKSARAGMACPMCGVQLLETLSSAWCTAHAMFGGHGQT